MIAAIYAEEEATQAQSVLAVEQTPLLVEDDRLSVRVSRGDLLATELAEWTVAGRGTRGAAALRLV